MTETALPPPRADAGHDAERVRPRLGAARVLFTATIGLNAALLFAVEPLAGRLLLPLFGGTPAVWATSLMVFQGLLLAGYLYAHLLARALGPRAQAGVHLALATASLVALPIAVRQHAPPTVGTSPVVAVVALLLAAIGLPFFVLSAGAPLLQRWFAHTRDPGAANPYFLYAASNAGSFLALLGYPLLLEPHLRLAEQGRAWSAVYGALLLLLAACGVAAARAARGEGAGAAAPEVAERPPEWRERGLWVLLAFVPSTMLLGVTRHLTTDVAPIPLVWVLPLALYLLTFVVAFARQGPVRGELADAQALVLPPLAIFVVLRLNEPLALIALLHLVAFTLTALVCHWMLAQRRPGVAHLTEFYLWLSVGGLLGGMFNALLAPVVFDTLAEYPLAIALAALARPGAWWAADPSPPRSRGPVRAPVAVGRLVRHLGSLGTPAPPPTRRGRLARRAAVPLAVGGLALVAARRPDWLAGEALLAGVLGAAAAILCYRERALRAPFALALGALLVGGSVGRNRRDGDVLLRARSFFGTYVVRASGTYHHLTHGTTLHGAQNLDPAYRRVPLTYYHRGGPLGGLFAHLPGGAASRRVAVAGLGTGTVACHGRPGERWTFYEIDPLIERIARDPRYFTYLRDCPPRSDVVVGDVRVRLREAPDGAYDVILLDAFSSDAIPIHLVTREALALYLSKLAPGGVIAFHVSNRYLDLQPVLAELARDRRLAGAVGGDADFTTAQSRAMMSYSSWVVLARDRGTLYSLVRQPGWRPLPVAGRVRLWTDDYSNVLALLKWK